MLIGVGVEGDRIGMLLTEEYNEHARKTWDFRQQAKN